jgi:sulfane dehydrogenase subunit SoxC
MSVQKQRATEDAIVRDVLKTGPNLDRRTFFVSAGAFGAAAAAVAAPGDALAQAAAPAPAAPAAAAPARRIFQKSDARLLNIGATVRSGNYWDFSTWITPVEEFYIRNHYPTPTPAEKPELVRENWKLRIHGAAVERPIEFNYNDLIRMPSRTIIATMECHGNSRTLFWEQQGFTGEQVAGGNWVMGAVGNAEWRYVPMSHILGLVGLKPNALTALFWSGVDGTDMGRPMPVSELLARGDDIGVCYQMNGNDLTPDHGAPVRLVVPGWGGTASIKWLTEIRITDKRVWCRLNTRGEVYIGPSFQAPAHGADDEFIGVTAADVRGPMVTWMPPKSTLTVPLVIERSPSLPANYPLQRGQLPTLSAGRNIMRGYAWGPQHGVKEVDYRINGGGWQPARVLQPNMGRYTWVRFEFPWDATAGDHVIETRTTDGSGYRQPAEVPLNTLGMANGAIPKFRIRVA